jgi:hypothetical protein
MCETIVPTTLFGAVIAPMSCSLVASLHLLTAAPPAAPIALACAQLPASRSAPWWCAASLFVFPSVLSLSFVCRPGGGSCSCRALVARREQQARARAGGRARAARVGTGGAGPADPASCGTTLGPSVRWVCAMPSVAPPPAAGWGCFWSERDVAAAAAVHARWRWDTGTVVAWSGVNGHDPASSTARVVY